jgi:hypothetical protein
MDWIKSRLGFIEKRDVVDLNRLTTFREKEKTRKQHAYSARLRQKADPRKADL